ncbi:MAG: pepA, partial [Klenkia sp.]|nr:pepA [Klenkia sp.]
MPPTISATDRPLEKLSADAVVVGVGKGPDGLLTTPGADAVDRLLGGKLLAALADLGARGGEDEVTRLPTFGQGPFPVVAVAGLGAPQADGGYPAEAVRRASGAASRALVGRASVVSLLAAVGGPPDAERLHAVGEGALLGAYEFTTYQNLPADRPTPPTSVELVVPDAGAAKAALARVRAVADAVALTRDLVNTPPNDLYPAELAARGAAAGKKAGLSVEVLDEAALTAGGYGGILAVGGGSTRGPRLLRLTYKGRRASRSVALVGKGITFDSGGISIKPAPKMEDMN